MRVCSRHGCPEIYPSTEGSRCPRHRREARAKRVDNAVYKSPEHREFRTAVITRDPVCVLCRKALSTVADHHPRTRRELVAQGADPNDPTYGRGLCAPCHNAHTAATSPGGWNTP